MHPNSAPSAQHGEGGSEATGCAALILTEPMAERRRARASSAPHSPGQDRLLAARNAVSSLQLLQLFSGPRSSPPSCTPTGRCFPREPGPAWGYSCPWSWLET